MEEENNIYNFVDKNLYKVGETPEGETTVNMSGSGSEIPGDKIISGEIDGNLSFIGGFIQSKNFVSGSAGWRLSADGTLEAINATLSGTITATAGTIGGWAIGATTLTGTNVVLNSAGVVKVTQSTLSNIRMDATGYSFFVSDAQNASIELSAGATPYLSGTTVTLTFKAGGDLSTGIILELNKTASNTGNFSPGSGDAIDLGTATNYFYEINHKTIVDRGCLGWFDDGVELQDGRIVKDTEALLAIRKHPTRKTIYGVDMLDYSSMPKVVYRPVPIATEDIYENGEVRFKKGEKIGEDGSETTALVSIMIGAIKELTGRVKELEEKVVQ